MGSIQVPTGTRATLATRAAANQLVAGRLYYLTDDQSFVIATSTNKYQVLANLDDVSMDIFITGNS